MTFMRYLSLFLVSILVGYGCTIASNEATEVPDMETLEPPLISNKQPNFESNQAQADSLRHYFEQLKTAEPTAKQQLEKKFFSAFPNSFGEMEELFGFDSETSQPPYKYDSEKPEAPLYHQEPDGAIIVHFGQMTSIPSEVYFQKYVAININGVWQADNIRDAFGFHKRLISDTKAACAALASRSDEEVKSVFHFIFDGPHPDNDPNHAIYAEIQPLILAADTRLGNLLKATFDEMMTHDHSH